MQLSDPTSTIQLDRRTVSRGRFERCWSWTIYLCYLKTVGNEHDKCVRSFAIPRRSDLWINIWLESDRIAAWQVWSGLYGDAGLGRRYRHFCKFMQYAKRSLQLMLNVMLPKHFRNIFFLPIRYFIAWEVRGVTSICAFLSYILGEI